MTREERLDWLCRLRSNICVYMPKEWIKPMNEALTDYIKALEQEPKSEHWITHFDDLFPGESTMKCSECGEHQPITIDDSYCPNCGAKMEQEDN